MAINLYNLERAIIIENAPVKNQSSRDYFYGKSTELEETIQSLEGRYARVVRDMCEHPRHINGENLAFLSAFWIFQHVRTESMQQSLLRQSHDLRDLFGEDVEELTLTKDQATLIALSAFAKHSDAISDLKALIIQNRSDTPFVTSDNPAVQTNRWALKNSSSGVACFGMHSAGLIALLPITPTLLVFLFDRNVYSIPHEGGILVVKSPDDIRFINEHQLLNCASNLYLSPNFTAAHAAALPDLSGQRQSSGTRAQVFQKRNSSDSRYYAAERFDRDKRTEGIVATTTYFASPTGWPSFLHWRNKGFYYANGSGAGQLRRAKVPTQLSVRPFQKFYTGR